MRPLKFREILKPTLWGGTDITAMKAIRTPAAPVGESWEISGVPGAETPVDGDDYAGMTLRELTRRFGAELVGAENLRRYGDNFPLLVKFISAARDLSIQVHPDDAMARRLGHPFGKTEMWYIVRARQGAMICSGFNHEFSPADFTRSLAEGTLCNHLRQHESRAGDCFFIPAGRIHSIGAGNFLIEVQQSSDDTFRVYDFNRIDQNGERRSLHVDLAREALDYEHADDNRTNYLPVVNRAVTLIDRPEFTTRLYQLNRPLRADYADIDSFVIFVAFEGAARLIDASGHVVRLCAGESVLFPASNDAVEILPEDSRPFGCLETFIR